METIWLQRSNADVPWGFRLQGGREYGVPLSVQRVTPGSVAAAGLCQGDLILKIGTISTNDLGHMEGQELIKRAGNILQLTIRKTPMSPSALYGSQVTAQLQDSGGVGGGGGVSLQNHHHHPSSYPATHTALPDGSTRIQIQRSAQPAASSGPPLPPTPQGYDDNSPFAFSDPASRMPDYTIPYRHGAGGGGSGGGDPYGSGPYGAEDGYRSSQQNAAYSSMSLPRGVGYGAEPRRQEARTLPINLSHQPASQPAKFNPTQAYESRIGSSRYPDPLDEITAYTSGGSPSAFSPAGASQPLSPTSGMSKMQVSSSGYPESGRAGVNSYTSGPYSPAQQPAAYSRPQQQGPLSPTSPYTQHPPALQRGYSQEQPAGYGQDQRGYYGSQPQPYERAASPPQQQQVYSPRTPYQQQQQQQPQYNSSYGAPKAYGGDPQPDPYTTPRPEAPPSYSQTFPRRQSSGFDRQMSSDRSQQPTAANYDDGYVSNTVFNQQAAAGVSDFGYEEPVGATPTRAGPQPYRPAEPAMYKPSVPQPYRPPESTPGGYRRQDSNPLSPGVRSVQPDFSRPAYSPQTSREYGGGGGGGGVDYGVAPPPPPPPAPSALASGQSWTPPGAAPGPRRSSQTRGADSDGSGGQKVPDELLSTVLKPKGAGPKPFSYGVDLNELKKKIGPPTAPKTFRKKSASPAGGRDSPDNVPMYSNKPAAGHVQSDYRRKDEGGPRAEIDTSPINISMGTNPKKQSMSFKVLQWMTDTENTPDEPGQPEPPQRARRAPRDPTVHNAEDDEMRFTGLHPKTEIPSRSFKTLQKMPNESSQNHTEEKSDNKEEEEEHRVGNYDETSIRYKGKHIPSPSFRVLQTWAETDPLETSGQQDQESDDGLPDTLSPEEMSDRRYKGGHIPSKVFKHLQKSVGDETPETPPNEQQNGGDAPAPRAAAKAPEQEVSGTDF